MPPSLQSSLPTPLSLGAFAGAAITLGLIGFCWSDFATDWQHVGPTVPGRLPLAYAAAAVELLGGLALFYRPTARAAALVLTLLYGIFALIWVPAIVAGPRDYGNWGNFFEELSAVFGGAVLFTTLDRTGPTEPAWTAGLCRFYGICVVSFTLVHIFAFGSVVGFVPAWIPLGQKFWAYATTIGFGLAAVSILTGIMDALASRLLAVMIIIFELLCWVPQAVTAPHNHFNWAGNGICILLAAAAWVIADTIAALRGRGQRDPAAAPVGEASPVTE